MNTSVERFLEAAFMVVPLFLVTRILVLAAPSAGRRVSRLILAVGIPAILLSGLAGGVFLDRWPRDLEALASTALILSVLLLLVWVPALLVAAARWAFRRRGGVPVVAARARGPEWLRVGLAGASVLVLVVFVQWGFYRDEARKEARLQEALKMTVRALEVTKRKEQEFEREVALLQAKLRTLDDILPGELALPRFMDDYRRVCERHGFAVAAWRASESADDRLMRADVDMTLEGPPEGLKGLAEATDRLTRLVAFRVRGVDGREVAATLTVYALRPLRGPSNKDTCAAAPHSEVWLWPLRGWIRAAHGERAKACAAVAGLDEIRRRVDSLEADRLRARDAVEVAERLLASRKTEVASPARPPEPSPVPAGRKVDRKTT